MNTFRAYAICCQPEVAGVVISSGNVKTAEDYALLNVEVASYAYLANLGLPDGPHAWPTCARPFGQPIWDPLGARGQNMKACKSAVGLLLTESRSAWALMLMNVAPKESSLRQDRQYLLIQF